MRSTRSQDGPFVLTSNELHGRSNRRQTACSGRNHGHQLAEQHAIHGGMGTDAITRPDKCEAHHQAVELLHAEADDAAGAEGSHAGSAARGCQVGSRAQQATGRDEAALASGRAVPPWTLRQQVALRVCA